MYQQILPLGFPSFFTEQLVWLGRYRCFLHLHRFTALGVLCTSILGPVLLLGHCHLVRSRELYTATGDHMGPQESIWAHTGNKFNFNRFSFSFLSLSFAMICMCLVLFLNFRFNQSF